MLPNIVFIYLSLNKWNGAKEIVKKHLVILLLYVITKVHDNICRHSQPTGHTTPSQSLTHFKPVHVSRAPCSNPHFTPQGLGFFGMHCFRDKSPLNGMICSSIG
ncbi:hypothetical protein NQD34_018112 [Periophthalmus magnuspinnatus]|nr:hypothetical protein NQD34_018112 [Periophthalmus magnuspinnatus]